jgi:hypothetical protein
MRKFLRDFSGTFIVLCVNDTIELNSQVGNADRKYGRKKYRCPGFLARIVG